MEARTEHLATLLELENRHEELLGRLAELDTRVEQVLKQCQAGRELGGNNECGMMNDECGGMMDDDSQRTPHAPREEMRHAERDEYGRTSTVE
jgi:hypothetical protein